MSGATETGMFTLFMCAIFGEFYPPPFMAGKAP
ncbi:MAG: hypothetical protein ACI92N_002137 [Pseudomonadales bacterium]|jgi:hypothetical protein